MVDYKINSRNPTQDEIQRWDKWNDSLKDALINHKYQSFLFLLAEKRPIFQPGNEIFNLIINLITDGYFPLARLARLIKDKTIQSFDIDLSDDEFKKVMLMGGLGNIFRVESFDIKERKEPLLWKHQNIQDYLTFKFSDEKCIQTLIDEIFSKKSEYHEVYVMFDGCYEILKFSSKNNKHYAFNLICEKLNQDYIINMVKSSPQLMQKSLMLLEIPDEYNLQVKGKFWEELRKDFLENINKSLHKGEFISDINQTLTFFKCLIYEYANIPNILNIPLKDETLEIYSNNIAVKCSHFISLLRSEQNLPDKGISHLRNTINIVNESADVYKKLRNKVSAPEITDNLLFKNIGNFITNEDVSLIESCLSQINSDSFLDPSSKLAFEDNFGQIKKAKILDVININKIKKNKVKVKI